MKKRQSFAPSKNDSFAVDVGLFVILSNFDNNGPDLYLFM